MAAIAESAPLLRGTVLRPGDLAYDEARRGWNLAVDPSGSRANTISALPCKGPDTVW